VKVRNLLIKWKDYSIFRIFKLLYTCNCIAKIIYRIYLLKCLIKFLVENERRSRRQSVKRVSELVSNPADICGNRNQGLSLRKKYADSKVIGTQNSTTKSLSKISLSSAVSVKSTKRSNLHQSRYVTIENII
jgi:hypothetical protein